ncbi:MAG: DMT family transporter [Alphaproteobacteria bacterium]|nr:DMT family transporter [Alphaproteobacteria bacterium]MDP6829882.1 DMT family transporter [Alphaproteobacteria bacterium]MDP6875571.1 DMT family transporter [Alphaproteobacteria bacterium]
MAKPDNPAGGKAPQSNVFGAALWMLGAVFSFSTMAVAGRAVFEELDVYQLMFYRSAIGLTLVLIYAACTRGGFGKFRTQRIKLHMVRNMSHLVGQFGWFFALGLIPLAQLFALEFTTPLWVAALAPLLLGERLTKMRLAAVSLGFIGVLVVLRPGLEDVSLGSIVMLIGAVGFAGAMMGTKRLSTTEQPVTVLFYMALIQTPVGLLLAINELHWPTLVTGLWLILVAVLGFTAHFCIVRAVSLADAIVVAPLDFIRLPLIAVVGVVLYSEPLELWVFVGGALVLLGNYGNLVAERRNI